MVDPFDPYLKWLGIREPQRPVNHYRLLGLDQFEADPEVIAVAAQRQIRHVETFADGPHSDVCQLVLLELENAQRCLMNPKSRSAYDQQIQQQSTTAPVVVVDSGGSRRSRESNQSVSSVAPKVNPGRPRRKPNRALADFFGWLLGAVGAVVFAFILLNTNLIDWIKGRADQPEGKTSDVEIVEPPVVKPLLPADSSSQNSRLPGGTIQRNPEAAGSQSSKPNSTEKKRTTEAETRAANSNRPDAVVEQPTLESLPPPRTELPTEPGKSSSDAAKLAVPDGQLLAQSLQEIETTWQAQFNSNNLNAKRTLAQSLLTNSASASKPEMRFAMLSASADVASRIGGLDMVAAAIKSMDQHFEIDFWETLGPLVTEAISTNVEFAQISSALIDLLDLARKQQRFELAAEWSDQASRAARKQGDAWQQKILADYSRDLKAMDLLHKKYLALESASDPSPSPADSLTIGTWWCFCRDDWQQGLPFLANGSDRQLASIAKMELLIAHEPNVDLIPVANEWFNVRTQRKYKGLDRRCISKHAIDLYGSSTSAGDSADPSINQNRLLLQQETRIIKTYVHKPQVMASRTFVFKVVGPATFDSAQLERGSVLRLGLGGRTQTLPVTQADRLWRATTQDGKTFFQIRLLEFDVAEMRVFDASNRLLTNILYGN